MKIIKTEATIKTLTTEQTEALAEFYSEYELLEEVYLYETIHGHIAEFTKPKGRYLPGEKMRPARLYKEQIEFLADVIEENSVIRWVEMYNGSITVGL